MYNILSQGVEINVLRHVQKINNNNNKKTNICHGYKSIFPQEGRETDLSASLLPMQHNIYYIGIYI